MAFVSAGYDGTVNETQFAKMLNRYSIVGADDFKATTIAGDRTVSIGNGTALGPGTMDTATDLPSIQFAAAAGTRWDLVVLRRDWQPPGGATAVVIVQGGASKALPAVGTAATAWNRRPGIMDDQPLYLQRVDGSLLGERIDLRCWASDGGVVVVDRLALGYLANPGAEVTLDYQTWRYLPDGNGVFGWDVRGSEFRVWNAVTTFVDAGPVNLRQSNINFPAGYFTVPPVVQATKQGGSGAKFIPYVKDITVNGCVVGLYTGDGTITSHGTLPVYIRAVQTSPTSSSGTL